MNINEISQKDYIVINDSSKISIGNVSTVEDFFDQAEKGLDIDGDLYCYIPDFDLELYETVKESAEDTIWFVFKKSEIPSWFKADEAVIINCGEEQERTERPNKISNNRDYNDVNYFTDNKEEFSEFGEVENDKDSDIFKEGMKSLFENSQEDSVESGRKEAKVYVYGSSKGGTGKTFTCLISAYRYGKTHPGERIAVADFDIIDGQVGISIHKIQPTMLAYWRSWLSGDKSFKAMKDQSTKSEHFPNNIDFYLAPKEYYINDKNFWLDILNNLVTNYDTVFFDTGIDYINYPPIAFTYKIADRIVLTSTPSIKSVSSVLKQISKLKGLSTSADAKGTEIFSKEDNIGPKLRLAITGCDKDDKNMNDTVVEAFSKNIKISAVFGQISSTISKAEYYGQWDIFDNNQKFNESLDRLMDLEQ